MGNFVFHIGRGELKCGNETVRLTERERELLRYFAQRPGMPVSRHELAKDGENGGERAIDVQINRLRRKIEKDPANPVYLQTVRGKGYILYPGMRVAIPDFKSQLAGARSAYGRLATLDRANGCLRDSMPGRSSSSSRRWCCFSRSSPSCFWSAIGKR